MKISIYPYTCAKAGKPVMSSFIKSVKDEDIQVFENNTIIDCDIAVIWAILWQNQHRKIIWETYKKRNIPVLVLEVGGLKRNEYWKVGINGINNNAIWGNENSSSDRWNKLNLTLKPWRADGDYIILCGQNDKSGAWPTNLSTDQYMNNTIKQIRQITNRPIWIRPHPRAPFNYNSIKNKFKNIIISKPEKYKDTYDNFNFDKILQNAWAVISYNSNPGMEAAINGVPVFCDNSSLTSPVGNMNLLDIENPKMPDRTQWAYDLAYTEWTNDEIGQGIPWNRLKRFI